MAGKGQKRKDKDRIVLRTGEGQRPNGTYEYRWTDKTGKRRRVYAKTLEELREKEKDIERDKSDGIKAEARCVTVNELFDLWKQIKRGLKDNTFQNYQYMYNTFVRPEFGKKRISTLKKTDVKRFYNYLADERGLQASTIDSIHTVLHQVLDMAVDDSYIRNNPSNNVLKELKQSHVFKTEKRKALTRPQQDLLLDFLQRNHTYNHWYPIFAVMLGTGLRVEKAILERQPVAESFEPYHSMRERRYPYYRIYVKNFMVWYVVIDDEGTEKVMEVRRFLYNKQNQDKLIQRLNRIFLGTPD